MSPNEKNITDARDAYIEKYRKFAEIPDKKKNRVERTKLSKELQELDAAHTKEVTATAKNAYDAKRTQLESAGLTGAKLDNELNTYFAREIVSRYIVGEDSALTRAKVEAWPPKEKGLFRKTIEWYGHQPRAVRIAMSATLATGAALAAPAVLSGIGITTAVGVSTSLGTLFMTKLARAGMGVGVTAGVEGGLGIWNKTIGKKKTREYRLGTLAEKMESGEIKGTAGEQFAAYRKEYDTILEETAKRERRQNIGKLLVSVAAGFGASSLAGSVIDHAMGVPSAAEIAHAAELESGEKAARSLGAARSVIAGQQQALLEKAAEAKRVLEVTQAKAMEHVSELATVKKGEGIWSAVYRQLDERLHGNPGKFNLKPEDLQDAAKVKKVLNKETMHILSERGYIKPSGEEVWIRQPGAKILLEPNNHISITGETYAHQGGAGGSASKLVTDAEHWKPTTPFDQSLKVSPNTIPGELPHTKGVGSAVQSAVETPKTVPLTAETVREYVTKVHTELSQRAASLESIDENFGKYPLNQQEGLLRTMNETTLPKINAVAEIGLDDENRGIISGIYERLEDMKAVYEKTVKLYYSTIENTGLSREAYEAAIVKPHLTVGALLETPDQGVREEFKEFAKLVSSYKPRFNQMGLTVDDFLKSKVVLKH